MSETTSSYMKLNQSFISHQHYVTTQHVQINLFYSDTLQYTYHQQLLLYNQENSNEICVTPVEATVSDDVKITFVCT